MSLKIPALKPILKEVAATAAILWQKGWAERNAGNISVNVTTLIKPMDYLTDKKLREIALPDSFPELCGQILLFSASGSRMRDLAKNPAKHLICLRINSPGSTARIIPLTERPQANHPTSELPTHLLVQQQFLLHRPGITTLLHSHATELIALSLHPGLQTKEMYNQTLLSMHPETVIFLPEGVGFVPYTMPGTPEIARLTAIEFQKHRAVLWQKHGGLACGNSPQDALDNLDIAAKAARIFLMCRSAGFEPEGMKTEETDKIREAYSGLF